MDTHPGMTAYGALAHQGTGGIRPESVDPLTAALNHRCGWGALGDMSLNEYQNLSTRTLPAESDIGPGSMSCLGMGIAGEAGELSDFLKKVVHHGHEDDIQKVLKELGDVLWYAAAIATRYGFTLEEVAVANVEKLKARYPEGFTSERSINRAQDE